MIVRRSAAAVTVALLTTGCGVVGGGDADCAALPGDLVDPAASFSDSFDGSGTLDGYVTNNPEALPGVEQRDGRYHVVLDDNSGNKTLHFHGDQGRLDARAVSFPFDYVARNIGIGTVGDPQQAPVPDNADTYIFAGVQVHDLRLDERNSSHVVVGHRGGTPFTIEGKNTCGGRSAVNDDGAGVLPDGRADIRLVGNTDRTLTVYYQEPNLSPATIADDWTLYRGNGNLPGTAPEYGEVVYIGIITYAFNGQGLPFVGTVDEIEDLSR